jgi:hypothetical protein
MKEKKAVPKPALDAPLGRITLPNGRVVSARLLAQAAAAATSDEEFNDMLEENGEAEDLSTLTEGGKRRQRGGDSWREWASAKVAFAKSVVLMTTYTAVDIAKMIRADPRTEAGQTAVYNYLIRELNPLTNVGKKLASIIGNLLEQAFVKGPITVAMLTGAGLAYTANVVGNVLAISNAWGRKQTEWMLNDDVAKKAAENAMASVTDVGKTTAVGLFVLNQIGVLPLSVLLAGILVAIQANFGTGTGRAYVVASFYAWYSKQEPGDRAAIDKAAKEYSAAAAAAAKQAGTEAADTAATAAAAAAKRIAALLAKRMRGSAAAGSGGGQNAFEAVKTGIDGAGEGATTGAAPAEETTAEAMLITATAAKAASIAAVAEAAVAAEESAKPARKRRAAKGPGAAGTGAASSSSSGFGAASSGFGDGDGEGGRRRKTRKRSTKRRVTRRRKAPKYLSAPVFAY